MPVSQGDVEQIFREEFARLPVTDIQDTDEFVDDELRGRTSEPAYHCLLADDSLIPNGSWPRLEMALANGQAWLFRFQEPIKPADYDSGDLDGLRNRLRKLVDEIAGFVAGAARVQASCQFRPSLGRPDEVHFCRADCWLSGHLDRHPRRDRLSVERLNLASKAWPTQLGF